MTGGTGPAESPKALTVRGLAGIPEVGAGDDLAAMIATAVQGSDDPLIDGDILVITSKIVSKSEGRVTPGTDREAAIDAETVRVVSEWTTPRGRTRIVENRQGLVMAAAGVDDSNVEAGHVALLPVDPDTSARRLRAELVRRTGVSRLGVIVSDTSGRAWRTGVIDIAIGAAGVDVVDDFRGRTDPHGNPLEVTVVAIADEIAAASELVRGKLAGVPVAVVRGLGPLVGTEDGPGARTLVRTGAEDRFRLGTPDAMRAAVAQTRDVRHFTGEPIDDAVLAAAVAVGTSDEPGFTAPEFTGSWRLEVLTHPDRIASIVATYPDQGLAGVSAMIVPHVHGSVPGTSVALGAALQNVRIRLAADGIGSAYLFPAEEADPAELSTYGVIVAGRNT